MLFFLAAPATLSYDRHFVYSLTHGGPPHYNPRSPFSLLSAAPHSWNATAMSRPELTAPPQEFYNDTEARKYTSSSRVIEIQDRLTERAVELLNFPDDGVPRLLLDVGCGSGLSGERLTELGHEWIGTDISKSMLEVAQVIAPITWLLSFDTAPGGNNVQADCKALPPP